MVIMDKTEYLLASQVAEMMGSKWTRPRVHTEYKRGTFPAPVKFVGKQPLWTRDQIQAHLSGKGKQ